jgi:hypothetical protein
MPPNYENAVQPPLMPVVVEEQQIDLVRVEKNLHALGFFAPTANREVSRTIVQVIRRPDGQRVQAKAVIEGIPSLGLPTTADRDKYMAFMKIALDQRDAQGQLANPVHFTGADMIKLLRLRKGGFHYDEINDWCKRMVATTIMSEASIFLADRKQYASDTFHVFDRVVLVGEELNDGSRSEHYQVYLSQWQLNNLNQGYILPLDFNAYLRLRRDIAKALFGHLSIWFYASRGQAVEKSYPDLCQLLNIRAYPHLSKAKAVLEPSMKELIDIGYLSNWEFGPTTRGSEFKLVLYVGQRLLSLPHFESVVNAEARQALEASLPVWVGELIKRGVSERKARQLALDVSSKQPVTDQIEYADHLIAQDRRDRGKIANPAGFYIWAIEQNLYVPDTFQTSTRSNQNAAQEEVQNDHQKRMLKHHLDYEEFCNVEARRKLDAQYPSDQREAALKEQMKLLRREQPEWFARVPESTRREVASGRLFATVKSQIKLPSFDQWLAKERQLRIF